jgi:hypothetical protein
LTTIGYKNHAVRSDKYAYIKYVDGVEEFYDMDKDPMQHNNLANNRNYRSLMDEYAAYLPKKDAFEFEVVVPLGDRKVDVVSNLSSKITASGGAVAKVNGSSVNMFCPDKDAFPGIMIPFEAEIDKDDVFTMDLSLLDKSAFPDGQFQIMFKFNFDGKQSRPEKRMLDLTTDVRKLQFEVDIPLEKYEKDNLTKAQKITGVTLKVVGKKRYRGGDIKLDNLALHERGSKS